MKIATVVKTVLGIALLIAVGVVINNGTSGPGAADLADHIAAAAIEVHVANQAQTCSVSSFAVDKLRARGVHITGRLLNNCDLAAGAQLKVTTYDKAGSILSVDDIWPASISNIPAHSAFPFEWLSGSGVDTFTVAVTSVKTWTGAK